MGAWDAVAGVLLALLGSYVFLAARTFPHLPGGYPGPGLFPQLLGGLLALSGAGLLAHGALTGTLRRRIPLLGASRKEQVRALLVVLAVILYILLVDRLGFVLLAFLILAGLMLGLGVPARWSVGLGVALTVLFYLLFGRLLHVPLPGGLVP
ncbi:MAG: tripartite tricarboxylate transporter TctB family protein [Armatimonadota bacterium]|nr:tripartite tricarboxylate transporter TctB family protein [Armatimonadota bacterium]MDR7449636.1 tripartite tricarboxylate transporter TctB family protein [Armatimonadota bacterium]MDR7458444.1 tripartite tricarboxylate transporter TctB family protein [Armatimonadota bacterium]MDR7478754.1 tripartite tricarboxylate transporter TctB family protein [Armatimonadota bacterium]MDR7488212.1 tripartite tricarboxylate transporter TctB family protein [Armatimonadota bacterium]